MIHRKITTRKLPKPFYSDKTGLDYEFCPFARFDSAAARRAQMRPKPKGVVAADTLGVLALVAYATIGLFRAQVAHRHLH